jgi:hypothetical protein
MLNRTFKIGALVLGAGLAVNVLIGKVLRRRTRFSKEFYLQGDRDFTPEQSAMLALIREQMESNSPLPGQVC